jgi:hypothetical protein
MAKHAKPCHLLAGDSGPTRVAEPDDGGVKRVGHVRSFAALAGAAVGRDSWHPTAEPEVPSATAHNPLSGRTWLS